MTDIRSAASSAGGGLRPAFAASRARMGLVVVLLVLAGAAWWWTVGQMRGMDDGPWTGRIYFHQGDDSAFAATRTDAKPRASRRRRPKLRKL